MLESQDMPAGITGECHHAQSMQRWGSDQDLTYTKQVGPCWVLEGLLLFFVIFSSLSVPSSTCTLSPNVV